jgi:hypothetical protein
VKIRLRIEGRKGRKKKVLELIICISFFFSNHFLYNLWMEYFIIIHIFPYNLDDYTRGILII